MGRLGAAARSCGSGRPARALRRAAAAARELLRGEGELLPSPELRAAFEQQRSEWETRNLKYVVLLGLVLCIFYSTASGFGTPLHVFVRVNNWLTVLFLFVLYAHRCLSRNRTCYIVLEAMIVLHYFFYISLTWDRVAMLVSLLMPDVEIENSLTEQDKLLGEPYNVLLAMTIICSVAHFHVVPTRFLLWLSVMAPCQWLVQVLLLGTHLDTISLVKLAGAYAFMSILAFLGGRRCHFDHQSDVARLHLERSEVMRVFRNASVPIFIVGLRSSTSRELCVELWNSALEEMTQISVLDGTLLRNVACLRSCSTSGLPGAIQRALGPAPERTQRMLMPLVAAPGVVWLQVDISPVNNDGMKAIIIGSDVSEFVAKHASLLHFIPEDSLAQQPHERPQRHGPTSRRSQGHISAELDPHALTVLGCSPQFNILLQRRMRGRPFLNYVAPESRASVRRAVEAALLGEPQSVEAQLSVVEPKRLRRTGHHSPARAAGLRFSLCSDGGVAEGTINVEVTLRAPEPAAEPPGRGAGGGSFRSDPGVQECPQRLPGRREWDAKSEPDVQERAWHARDAESEPAVEERALRLPGRHGQDAGSESAAENASRADASIDGDPACAANLEPGSAGVPKLEVVVLHLVDLSRHLCLPAFPEARGVLQAAVQHMLERESWYAKRWGRPCAAWRCPLCQGLNDEEDPTCEVCRLGEAPDAFRCTDSESEASDAGTPEPARDFKGGRKTLQL